MSELAVLHQLDMKHAVSLRGFGDHLASNHRNAIPGLPTPHIYTH